MKKNNNTEKAALDAIKISEALKKGTEKNLQSLINEAISNVIKESDDDDDDKETEKDEETKETKETEEIASEKDTAADSEEDDVTPDDESDMGSEMDDEESEDADDEWSDFDDYKVGDDEYDVTDEDDETALRIYNKLDDSDELVVTKDGEGNYEFETEDGNEYVIELPDESLFPETEDDDVEDDDVDIDFGGEDEEEFDLDDDDAESESDTDFELELDDEDNEDDEDFELELDDEEDFDDELNEEENFIVNDYQKNPFPGLKMNEPANSSATYSMDGGAPKGTERPYGKVGDGDPYGEANEGTNVGGRVQQHTTSKSNIPSGRREYVHPQTLRNASAAGERVENINEAMKKLRALQNENKQYKKALSAIKSSLKEAAVLNVTLGQVVKILCENATSKSEKKSIVERFNKVKTIKECKSLYETISRELNENKRTVVNIDKGYTTNSSKSLNETTIYSKENDNPSINLMKRMDNLWK